MRRALLALSTAVAVGASAALLVPAVASAAGTTDTLAVDFSQSTGAFRGGASGTLYGFGDDGAPTQAIINGARITNSSQKAPYGTQHPSGDALRIEDGFFDKHGAQLDIYIQDYYPDWAYNGGRRPGDTRTYDQATGAYTETPNGEWDYLEVVELVTEAVATQSEYPDEYVFIPFNEPDGGNWYNDFQFFQTQFLPDWKAAYDKIVEVYARHGLAAPVIGGPGDSAWHADRTAIWLDYVKQTDTIPQYMIWHELGIDNLRTYREHYAQYRAMEAARGIGPLEINITEYGLLRDMGVPGQLVQWFSMFEDTKVDAQTAYWNYAGNLSDNSARANGANAGWWMFKWYGDLAGSETVQVTPPELNAVDTLQGIGAIDADDAKATVLWGGSSADNVALDLDGLDRDVFGASVGIEVREAPVTGAEGIAGTPRVVQAAKNVALTDGALDLSVPNYDRYAGYQVIVTPSQDRAVTTDPVWSSTIEAEDSTITGARVYEQSPTDRGGWNFLASGGRDVGSFNNASAKADWTVTVPRTGTYRFQVIGATPGTPGRHALFVDDAKAATVQYTADLALNDTSRWRYRGSAEVEVQLSAGSHVLSLRASDNGTQVLPNSDITLDRFVLTDITDGEPTVYAASSGMRLEGATLGYGTAGSRGAAQLSGDGRADVYATAWDSGYYDVAVRYATATASSVTLDVNGRRLTSFEAPIAGQFTSTARVHLAEGINELELTSPAGAQVISLTTTRVKAADTAAVRVEAESGDVAGTARKVQIPASTGTNASGGTIVDYVGNGAGNTLSIPRAAGFDTPGLYDVSVGFANAELSGEHDYNPQVVDRRLQIDEAGVGTAGEAFFRYTYSWNSFWQRTVPIELTTGDGALVMNNATAYTPNLDYVIIAPALIGTPSTVEQAPTAPTAIATLTSAQDASADGWYNGTVLVALAPPVGSTAKVQANVDGAGWRNYSRALSVSTSGVHTVAHRLLQDNVVVAGSPGELTVKVDRTAPKTTGAAWPTSRSGSPRNPVTISFAVSDADSGVARTEYRLGSGAWTTATASVVFDTVGERLVSYRSVDLAGNAESVRSFSVRITEDPATSLRLSASRAKIGAPVTLALTGFTRWTDLDLSVGGVAAGTVLTDVNGVARITIRVPAGVPVGSTTVTASGSGITASKGMTVVT